jgi:hypothetical protein
MGPLYSEQEATMKRLVVLVIAALALTASIGAPSVTTASSPRAACGTSLETWFAPDGNGYAGGAGYVVEFSNIGTTTCTVQGNPTVVLTKNGKQVGLNSRHDPLVPVKTVTLKPGHTAHVVLFVTDAGALCRPIPTNGLSVRSPGSIRARVFPFGAGACRGKSTLRVDAINPGVGIPYYTIR